MTRSTDTWKPHASLSSLQLRSQLLAEIRRFFAARDVVEVETPVLVGHTVSDPQTDALQVVGNQWLRTSPEYHLKRLVAALRHDVYEIARVFRAGETGRHHQPEFTLLEWYRLGFSMTELAHESCDLVEALFDAVGESRPARHSITYRDAFMQTCQLDPLTATVAELAECAQEQLGASVRELNANRTQWLDLLASQCVYPSLAKNTLQIVSDYPADQAMLARLNHANPAVAERFEIFFNGIELANGYKELTDAAEQTRRFSNDNEIRHQLGKQNIIADPYLLDALHAGLPDCAGVAMGFDRVMMAATRGSELTAVLSFTPGE